MILLLFGLRKCKRDETLTSLCQHPRVVNCAKFGLNWSSTARAVYVEQNVPVFCEPPCTHCAYPSARVMAAPSPCKNSLGSKFQFPSIGFFQVLPSAFMPQYSLPPKRYVALLNGSKMAASACCNSLQWPGKLVALLTTSLPFAVTSLSS